MQAHPQRTLFLRSSRACNVAPQKNYQYGFNTTFPPFAHLERHTEEPNLDAAVPAVFRIRLQHQTICCARFEFTTLHAQLVSRQTPFFNDVFQRLTTPPRPHWVASKGACSEKKTEKCRKFYRTFHCVVVGRIQDLSDMTTSKQF